MIAQRNTPAFISSLIGLLLLSIVSNPNAAWVNATGDLAGKSSECGDLQSIWAVPNANMTLTGVANNGIYGTSNGGTNWTLQSASAVKARILQMVFDPDNPNTWYACGIYHSPAVAKTTNGGASWVGLGNVGTSDGMGVDFSDPQRKTLLAGTHEASNILWKSTDAGQTWANIGSSLPSGTASWPYIVNTQTYLMGLQGNGIYRSVNAGSAWTKVCNAPNGPITKSNAGDLYCAVGGKVYKGSTDGSTWTATTMPIANVTNPVELPGGRIASVNNNGIYISEDKGATYKTRCSPLPTAITGNWTGVGGFCYNSVGGAFYAFYWNCDNTGIRANQIWRYDTLFSGGTDVTVPNHQAISNTDLQNGLSYDADLYDLLGKSINRTSLGHSRLAAQKIFFVKARNGTVGKQIYRD